MPTKRRLTTLLSLAVLAETLFLGAAYYVKALPPDPMRAERPPFDFEVQYTAQGFEPPFIIVPLGARVAFKNTTASPLLTASDPFPSHTDYSEFVAKKASASGGVFVFEFDRAGTFGYGNDKRTEHRGVVQVYDPAAHQTKIDKTRDALSPLRDRLFRLFEPDNPLSVFKVVDGLLADKTLALSCHDLAHDIGHRAYELYGFSAAMNISDPSRAGTASLQEVCAGGYVHGLLEEAALYWPDLYEEPQNMCANVLEGGRSSCFHGLGHAFMYDSDQDVSASVDRCRTFDSMSDSYPCFEGVWMEFFSGVPRNASDPLLAGPDVDNPVAQCKDTGADQAACYLYSTFGYLKGHAQDYRGALKLCAVNGLDDAQAQFCVSGIGITLFAHFQGQQLQRTEPLAVDLNPAAKHSLYRGMIKYAKFSGVGPAALAKSCTGFGTDKKVCEQALAEVQALPDAP